MSCGRRPPFSHASGGEVVDYGAVALMPTATERVEEAASRGADVEAARMLTDEARRAADSGDRGAMQAARVALATFALVVDDDARADALLGSVERETLTALDTQARAWTARGRLSRRGGVVPRPLDLDLSALVPPLRVDVLLEQAAAARITGRRSEAALLVDEAAEHTVPGSRAVGLVLAARAELCLAGGDAAAAEAHLRAAIAAFAELGTRPM